ncbi:hypothetical protein [Microvirga lenta]|uniref:hypothetical protein n=1 Tax=Microvirga lenta TaxID=2881337 RepID=UPI001CFF7C0B|nr:hypothetical protein [Microvirga lenta]MCB5177588.1 hypothetical protein [Microvirga lenta]
MNTDERVEAMAQWFLANFEDPAQETPYESAEGGYQWVWGGPYDAREELGNAFAPIATDDEIERAASLVEEEGIMDWAPSSNRFIEEDDDSGPYYENGDEIFAAPNPSAPEPAEVVRRELDELEEMVLEWRRDHPGIGHNRPPDPIEDSLTLNDIDQITTGIAEARSQLDNPFPDPDPPKAAESRFRRIAQKIRTYLATVATVTGTLIIERYGNVLLEKLEAKLTGVADAIATWISALPPF